MPATFSRRAVRTVSEPGGRAARSRREAPCAGERLDGASGCGVVRVSGTATAVTNSPFCQLDERVDDRQYIRRCESPDMIFAATIPQGNKVKSPTRSYLLQHQVHAAMKAPQPSSRGAPLEGIVE